MKIPCYIVKNYLSQYYFRIHIEKALIPIVGKTELRKSLRTTCPIVAAERAKPMVIAAKAWFEKLKRENGMAVEDDWWKIATKVVRADEILRNADGSVTVRGFSSDGTPEDQETTKQIFGEQEVQSTPSLPQGILEKEFLSERLDKFIQLKYKNNEKYDKKTANTYINTVNLFIEIYGDRPMYDYSEDEAISFRDTMLQLPTEVRSKNKWIKMSIEQILEYDPDKKLSGKSVHDKLQKIRSIWTMAVKKKTALINIFEDVKVKYKVTKGQPFTHPELCDLFDPNNLQIDQQYPSHYFANLIALFSGMRRSEIFFRTVDEVKQENGIWYFDITEVDEKNTKNKKSIRRVPIHSELQRLGFLSYCEMIRSKGENSYLFPEYSNLGGQAGNKFTDYFIEYRKSLGITAPGKKFHSFRNTFISALESNRTYSPLLSRLVGHSTGSITHDGYGGHYPIEELAEAVEQVSFPNVTCAIPVWRV